MDTILGILRVKGTAASMCLRIYLCTFKIYQQEQNLPDEETRDDITIRRLVVGPSRQVTSWQAYDIIGYTYYTNTKDSTCVNQNSGIQIEVVDGVGQKTPYFGIIDDIWELKINLEVSSSNEL
jgi:hypothetical protein